MRSARDCRTASPYFVAVQRNNGPGTLDESSSSDIEFIGHNPASLSGPLVVVCPVEQPADFRI